MATSTFVKRGFPQWRGGENHAQYSMATGSFMERSSFFNDVIEKRDNLLSLSQLPVIFCTKAKGAHRKSFSTPSRQTLFGVYEIQSVKLGVLHHVGAVKAAEGEVLESRGAIQRWCGEEVTLYIFLPGKRPMSDPRCLRGELDVRRARQRVLTRIQMILYRSVTFEYSLKYPGRLKTMVNGRWHCPSNFGPTRLVASRTLQPRTGLRVMSEDAFVSVVEQYPIIYDKSRPDYKNIAKKDNAWGSIAEIMNCSVEHCQKTWGSLVAKYRRERKQKNTPPTSGSAYTKKTEWPLFEALNFMDKHIQMRRTFTNVNIPNKLDGNTSSNETPEENVEITPHCEPLIQSETPQIPREFQRSNTLSSQTVKILFY
uniref:MADF domain-containing protein n=1 Tax=Timema monikensis TaxID=170555 RepID=A0A7R9HJV0_9NEOP|nr:unnamed protein product [Timema monikensis]